MSQPRLTILHHRPYTTHTTKFNRLDESTSVDHAAVTPFEHGGSRSGLHEPAFTHKRRFTRATKLPRNWCYIILSGNVGSQQRDRTMQSVLCTYTLSSASLFAHPDLKGQLRLHHTAHALYIQQGIMYITLPAREPKSIHKTHVAGLVIFGFITGVSSVQTPAGISYIWNTAS